MVLAIPPLVLALVLGWLSVSRTASRPTFLTPPGGFVPDRQDSGTLDLAGAQQITVAPAADVGARLASAGFRSGASRLWNSADGEFAESVRFGFASAAGARRVVDFEMDYVARLAGDDVRTAPAESAAWFRVPGLPAVRGFVANGSQTADGAPLFVTGAWFVAGDEAWLVELGGTYPQSRTAVVPLITEQYHRVR